MTQLNKTVFEKVDQLAGYIHKMFYIAAQTESKELHDFLEDTPEAGEAIYSHFLLSHKPDEDFKNITNRGLQC